MILNITDTYFKYITEYGLESKIKHCSLNLIQILKGICRIANTSKSDAPVPAP